MEGLKMPPHSLEAEQSVLGGLMLDNERWDNVAERVVANDFFSRPHRLIFTEMQRLLEMSKPIDLITLSESLEQKGELDSVGGFAYRRAVENTPSAANIGAYADIVRERAVVREMISVANEIADAGYDPQAQQRRPARSGGIPRVPNRREPCQQRRRPEGHRAHPEDTVSRIEQLYQQPHDGVTGVDTGYQDLNKKTAGMQKSDLIIVAARPSMGKTTFAMNLCENAAMTQKTGADLQPGDARRTDHDAYAGVAVARGSDAHPYRPARRRGLGAHFQHHGYPAGEAQHVHRRLLRPDADRSALARGAFSASTTGLASS